MCLIRIIRLGRDLLPRRLKNIDDLLLTNVFFITRRSLCGLELHVGPFDPDYSSRKRFTI